VRPNFGSPAGRVFRLSQKSLFTLAADADRRLSFNFEWIADDNERTAETFKAKLETLGFKFPEDYKRSGRE
jgi:hypothetical protein